MSAIRGSEPTAMERAAEIARRTLAGELDPLLGCRDIAALRGALTGVPESAMDTCIAVASEVDDLPLGNDRQYWAPEVLKVKDAEAADYRARVEGAVHAAMRELVSYALHGPHL